MSILLSVLLRLGLALVFVGGIAYLASGAYAMWVAISLTLAGWIGLQLRYLAQLIKWLKDPKQSLEGVGVWDHIFSQLLAQTKESKKQKFKISASLDRFNRIAEAVPDGLLILNQEGRLEWFNKLAAKHLNLNVQDDQNGILQNLVRQPDFQRFLQKRGPSAPLVVEISLPNGGFMPRTIRVERFKFENRNELLVTQDISEKRQIDANQVAFVANVSHELRTPLTVVNGFLETLADNPHLPAAQQQQFISLMRQEGQRMLSVLSDLLMLSRLEKGGVQPFESFNLSELVKEIAQEGRNLSKEQHIFEITIAPDLTFYGIQNELHSALSNLVFNAIRYTPEQGKITIRLERQGDKQARFSVQDTGVGIAPEHIPRLTERFYRVDNSRSRQNGGTGLGLAITKFALAKYNAELEIESEVGKGSCFAVTLPLIV
ncbi:phosphate regulon sensor histidine kinase PhoR [Pasteurellaceae bacterium RH1A]|nr:phosphate regulon sensor histidine kinase PhoR [Pasteurellaceae bacterium RH1A]